MLSIPEYFLRMGGFQSVLSHEHLKIDFGICEKKTFEIQAQKTFEIQKNLKSKEGCYNSPCKKGFEIQARKISKSIQRRLLYQLLINKSYFSTNF